MRLMGWRDGRIENRARRRRMLWGTAALAATIAASALPASATDQTRCCGQIIGTGQQVNTGTGELLAVQGDGNVVLYQNGIATWHTNSGGKSNPYLAAQSDGNVVAYGSGSAFWKTNTGNYPGAYLRLQDDGNLVVYNSSGSAVWAKSWTQSASGAKTYAQAQFSQYGWSTSTQFGCLNNLWTGESNWLWNADNPNSSAYGIPQSLPGSKMSTEGTNWLIDGLTQVQWGHKYISTRYQTPCGAYNAWLSRSPHWY